MTKTVVCVSPLRLDRDSRSHRAALSFQRFGHRVVVVEAEASATDPRTLPFPLITLNGRAGAPDGPSGNGRAPGTGLLRRLLRGPLWEIGTFIWFVIQVFVVYVIKGLRKVPRADLYYLHEYRLFPMVYVLARRSTAKIFYDAHDFYPGVHRDADLTPFWRRVFRPFLVWLEGLCLRHVAGMVTVNQGIADLYKETFGIDAEVTRNCHDPEMEAPVEKDIRQVLGLGDGDFLLVTVGNSKPGQDVRAALRAMTGLQAHVHLAFLGRGYDQYAPEITDAGLEKRVHHLPPVAADRVVPFIRSADAALILYYGRSPNDHLSLPNGFFHGIAARLPTLYPGLPWIKEVAEGYGIGVEIDPRDPKSIRDGIERLMAGIENSGYLRENLALAARENTWAGEEGVLKDVVAVALKG